MSLRHEEVSADICRDCLFLLNKAADAAGFDDRVGSIVVQDTLSGDCDFLDDCLIKNICVSSFF